MTNNKLSDEKEDEFKWLKDALPLHERLGPIIAAMTEGILIAEKIDYLHISFRTKEAEKIKEKILRKNYTDPQSQLTDLTGIRVITFFESQVKDISNLLHKCFNVDSANSLDKSEDLGIDRIGYRSIHLVCDLGDERSDFPEYAPFKNLKFEIQIRTVLQHAWASFSHDRDYKFAGDLPKEIKRELNLYAGMLELADIGFSRIATAIDAYLSSAKNATPSDLADLEINTLSLESLQNELSSQFGNTLRLTSKDRLADVATELRHFGFRTIKDIHEHITEEYVEAAKRHLGIGMTLMGILRSIMLYTDIDRYFKRAYSPAHWAGIPRQHVDMLKEKYPAGEVDQVFEEHGIKING